MSRGVPFDKLPADVRAKVQAQTGTTRKRTTKHAASVKTSPCTCHECGATFPRFEAWEKHCDESGHPRCDLTLEEA